MVNVRTMTIIQQAIRERKRDKECHDNFCGVIIFDPITVDPHCIGRIQYDISYVPSVSFTEDNNIFIPK